MPTIPAIVIVGAAGRLGQALQLAAAARAPHAEVICLSRAQADLSVAGSVATALEGRNFDLLLMAAAMTDVDGCERDEAKAQRLNGDAPGECARLCAERGARMIHFSTDYVFDGSQERPYTEQDATNPGSAYGRTKLDGERQVMGADPNHLVVRLSWLYGAGGENATPDWVIPAAVAGKPLKLVADKTGSPSYSTDIAEAVGELFFRNDIGGVLHLCNEGVCTWIDWARECLRGAHQAGLLEEVPEIAAWTLAECFAGKAARPLHSAMDCSRYAEITGRRLRSWQEALADYVADVAVPRLKSD